MRKTLLNRPGTNETSREKVSALVTAGVTMCFLMLEWVTDTLPNVDRVEVPNEIQLAVLTFGVALVAVFNRDRSRAYDGR